MAEAEWTKSRLGCCWVGEGLWDGERVLGRGRKHRAHPAGRKGQERMQEEAPLMPQEGLHPLGRAQGFSGEEARAQSLSAPSPFHPLLLSWPHPRPAQPPSTLLPPPPPRRPSDRPSQPLPSGPPILPTTSGPPSSHSLLQQTPPQEVCLPAYSPQR